MPKGSEPLSMDWDEHFSTGLLFSVLQRVDAAPLPGCVVTTCGGYT